MTDSKAMNRARDFVRRLDMDSLTYSGLEAITREMDNFSEKERFEVLLLLYAHAFLGISEQDELPNPTPVVEKMTASGGLPAIPTTGRVVGEAPRYKSPLTRFFGK